MATYASLLSSAISAGSSADMAEGKTVSSIPGIMTAGNSSPFAEWTVIRTAASAASSYLSMSDTSAFSSRNPSRVGESSFLI